MPPYSQSADRRVTISLKFATLAAKAQLPKARKSGPELSDIRQTADMPSHTKPVATALKAAQRSPRSERQAETAVATTQCRAAAPGQDARLKRVRSAEIGQRTEGPMNEALEFFGIVRVHGHQRARFSWPCRAGEDLGKGCRPRRMSVFTLASETPSCLAMTS